MVFTNVAIMGGGGGIGSQIVKFLLSEGDLPITIITRTESEVALPQNKRISVQRGQYDSPDFLQTAMRGHDVLICAMGLSTPPTTIENVYKAASLAGVQWIIPQGWGNNFLNPKLAKAIPPMQAASATRTMITAAGMSYTGFITNPWLEMCLKDGYFSIDVACRKATLYTSSVVAFNVSTMAQVGMAIARFITLGSRHKSDFNIEDYKNKELYISPFLLTQEQLLASVQRATETRTEDWQVVKKDVQEYIAEGNELMQQGAFMKGLFLVLFGCLYSPGFGGNYEDVLANKALGLPQQSLDEEVRKVVRSLESST